jgi:hypothetical protein
VRNFLILLAISSLSGCKSGSVSQHPELPRPTKVVDSKVQPKLVPPVQVQTLEVGPAPTRIVARAQKPPSAQPEPSVDPTMANAAPHLDGNQVDAPNYPVAAKRHYPRRRPSIPAPTYYRPSSMPTVSRLSARPQHSGYVPPSYQPPVPDRQVSYARNQQVQEIVAQQQQRIQQQNQRILEQFNSGPAPMTYPYQQAYAPVQHQSAPSRYSVAEQRFVQARTDLLNTKYCPNGPARFTPEVVRGMVGHGMPLPPNVMNQPATFNPVLQKAQQAEYLRQEMIRVR